ncbi:MAG: FAD-binding oxidoreductase [Verrucomicrobiota bacterium]
MTEDHFIKLSEIVPSDCIVREDTKVEKYSKDYAWFSPILKRELADKKADAVVLVPDRDALIEIIRWCYQETIPVTIRGGGTGNYGQCTPLFGGLLLELMQIDRIISAADGEMTMEPGVRIFDLENEARKHGMEMRCMPSTWVKSSIAGFICGGSGGIGSISYGGTANGGMVKQLKILTLEAKPRILSFSEDDCLPAINTYGTTGVVVELTLRMASKRQYDQHIFTHSDFDLLFKWCHKIANDSSYPKRLVTFFEDAISATFAPLAKQIPSDEHSAFILVDVAHSKRLIEDAEHSGIKSVHFIDAIEPLRPPYITDYTWNHTMLWLYKANPDWTYSQIDYGEDALDKIHALKKKFPEEIYTHIEWVKATSKWKGDDVVPGGGPAILYSSDERLAEISEYAESIGCAVTSPHVYHLEEGYFEDYRDSKMALKELTDPAGILNPGKMSAYPKNPFVQTVS